MRYWCETCLNQGSKSEFKTSTKVFSHLKKIHGVTVFCRGGCRITLLNKKTEEYSCPFCHQSWKFVHGTGRSFAFAEQHEKTHAKYAHAKYVCDDKTFRTIINLLRYIDSHYAIHICFISGIVKKRVFLDGITK